MKKTLFVSVAVFALWATVEALAWLGLAGVRRLRGIRYEPVARSLQAESRDAIQRMLNGELDYWTHDTALGWSVKPNGVSRLARSNSQAIRADRNFSLAPPEGTFRITTFGNSFIHGEEVGTEDTFQEILMRKGANLEVLNFGVAGYGLDQAMLRYKRDGARFGANIVLIGFMSENIFRSVSAFRPFYTHHGPPFGKPRYTLIDNQLTLINNPLPRLADYGRLLADEETELRRLGQNDFFFQTGIHAGPFDFLPSARIVKLLIHELSLEKTGARVIANERYNASSPAFQVTVRIFDEFYRIARQDGAIPVIIVFPSRVDFRRDVLRYEPLLDYFRSRDYAYIDMLDAFRRSHDGNDFASLFGRGHYSPLGNRIVAEMILDYLESNCLTLPSEADVGSTVAAPNNCS